MIEIQALISPPQVVFWENELEVGAVEILERAFADASSLTAWMGRLSAGGLQTVRELLQSSSYRPESLAEEAKNHLKELAPVALCHEFMAGKRTEAIEEVARSTLAADVFLGCQFAPNKPDRFAMLWELFQREPDHLKDVLLLHKALARGYARLTLTHRSSSPAIPFTELFTVERIQAVLDANDAVGPAGRRSYCAGILEREGGRRAVFVKRDLKLAHVAQGPNNFFGYERDYMVFDFQPSMEVVDVAAVNAELSVLFASAIGSAYFGKRVAYDDARELTRTVVLDTFLTKLEAMSESLPIVAFRIRNSPFDGSPELEVFSRNGKPVNKAIRQVLATATVALAHPADVLFIKVFVFRKRVKVIFTQSGPDAYEVRYDDSRMKTSERRAFERLVYEHFGVRILTTEKRRAA